MHCQGREMKKQGRFSYYIINIYKRRDDMPLYEYKCLSCGEEFERLVFSSQEVTCPKCQSVEVSKKFSVFGMSGVEKPFAGSEPNCSSCSNAGGKSCSSC